MIRTKYILNKEEKARCDALPAKEKEKILNKIESSEKNLHTQLEHLRVLKLYYADVSENEKDVYGRGIQGGYKYRKEKNR